jgi:hypothetical protein
MKMTIRWRRFIFRTLFLTTTSLLCLPSIHRVRAQDKTAEAAGISIHVEDFLDPRGDLPTPGGSMDLSCANCLGQRHTRSIRMIQVRRLSIWAAHWQRCSRRPASASIPA